MGPILLLFACLAPVVLAPVAPAADNDFNGRRDLIVHKTPADRTCWMEITGAGTAGLKGSFGGSPAAASTIWQTRRSRMEFCASRG